MSNEPLTEIQSLKSQIAALEQLLEVFENATIEQSDKLYAEIAERKQAEELLQESEVRHRAILETVQAGIVIIDANTHTIIEINPAAVKMIGATREQIIGNVCNRHICPADLGKCPITDLKMPVDNSERILLKADGTGMPIIKTVAPIILGGRRCLIESFVDITERKQAEALLSESEEKFRAIFDKASDGLLLADAESKRFLMGNEAIGKMLGYSREELGQLGVRDIHPQEELPATLEAFEKLVKGEIALTAGRSMLRKDGSTFYADIRASLIKLGARRYLLGTFRDITERRQAEAEVAFKNTILATQQECSLDGILVVDENADIISFNRRFVELWGIPPELVEAGIDEPVLQFVATRPADPEGFLARVRYLYEHREEKSRDEITLKDGRVFDRYSAPMTGADEKYYGRVWYFRDITVPKRAEKEVHRLNEELEQKVEQLLNAQEELVRKEKLSILGQLSGSVGHELRNPLGVMSNAVYFLKVVHADGDETTKEYLDIIKKEIDNSLRIITDLLDFARTRTPQIKTVTAHELIAGSLGRCEIPGNIDIQTEIPDNLPLLRIDTLQMGQVLTNLIANAVQAMPDGGALRVAARLVLSSELRVLSLNLKAETSDPKPNTDLSLTSEFKVSDSNSELKTQNSELDGDFIAISVTDTGVGITPENMKKLFQPLFTTKAKGIGLGLVVCRSLVEADGGRIAVESELGEGTTFTVVLPIERI